MVLLPLEWNFCSLVSLISGRKTIHRRQRPIGENHGAGHGQASEQMCYLRKPPINMVIFPTAELRLASSRFQSFPSTIVATQGVFRKNVNKATPEMLIKLYVKINKTRVKQVK